MKKVLAWVAGLIGSTLGVLAVLLAVLALEPNGWRKSLSEWYAFVVQSVPTLDHPSLVVGIVTGVIASVAASLVWEVLFPGASPSAQVVDFTTFQQRFDAAIKSRAYTTIKIFGYTSETVSDFFQYSMRYLKNSQLLVLNRSWLVEAADEFSHNEKIKSTPLRPWNKSQAIRHAAFQPWPYKIARHLRFYAIHPIVKGIILEAPSSGRREAFFTFYEWQELPSDGGSEFKGGPLPMIHLTGSTVEESHIIEQLNSQFELLWKHNSQTKEFLASTEQQISPATTGPATQA